MAEHGWERGDLLGHDVPVDIDALRSGGAGFLTDAFHAAGTLAPTNAVAAITELAPASGGSTGRKAVLTVAYADPAPDLPGRLFVKFSRDLDHEGRDRGRWQMESEVRFGLLSSIPDFPVAVPHCMFGEYALDSGTGVLITERIPFGEGGIEPLHEKAKDHEIADVLTHYEALVTAIGRLAGSHRAGRFPEDVMVHFDRKASRANARKQSPYTRDELHEGVARYADFAERHPRLLPPEIRSAGFVDRLLDEGARANERHQAIRDARQDGYQQLFAFCHWNANIDNAWFWRDEDGTLRCGLMDWGNVGQINMANALTSALMFAEPEMVIAHGDRLLDRFADAFEDAGADPLDRENLARQFALNLVVDGLRLPLDRVALIERRVPDLATAADRSDPRIADDEFARTQLHILRWALSRWQALDVHGLIDHTIGSRAER